MQLLRFSTYTTCLLCALFLIHLPLSAAESTATTNVAFVEEGVVPKNVKEKPVSKKRRIHKSKKEQKWKADLKFLFFAVPVLMGAGAVLFAIGIVVPLFGLWLAGLLLFGILNLALLSLLFIIKLTLAKGDNGMGGVMLAILFLIFGAITLLTGLTLLIWGLIIITPLMWIVGLSSLFFTGLYLLGIFVKN